MVNKDLKPSSPQFFVERIRNLYKVLGTILLFVHVGNLHVRIWCGIIQNLAVDVLLGTLFLNVFYSWHSSWRERSRTMAFRPDTHPRKTVCQGWTAIVAPRTIKLLLRTTQEHCMDCEANHSTRLHLNASECNHTRFISILTSASQSTKFLLPRHTRNSRYFQGSPF